MKTWVTTNRYYWLSSDNSSSYNYSKKNRMLKEEVENTNLKKELEEQINIHLININMNLLTKDSIS